MVRGPTVGRVLPTSGDASALALARAGSRGRALRGRQRARAAPRQVVSERATCLTVSLESIESVMGPLKSPSEGNRTLELLQAHPVVSDAVPADDRRNRRNRCYRRYRWWSSALSVGLSLWVCVPPHR